MTKKTQTKQIIKISNNIETFWCKKKKILIINGPLKRKIVQICNLVTLNHTKQNIEVLIDYPKKVSNREKKKIQSMQKTTIAILKQELIEVTAPIYRKLTLVGVGYRAFPVEGFESKLLLLKLGFSHPIYIKIPSTIKVSCLKLTKLFLYGYSYNQITSIAAKIRSNKTPEPYKGKGILYENEKINLKEGKKV